MWDTVVKLGISERPLAVGPESIPCAQASLLEDIPYDGMPFLALRQGGGSWFWPNIMYQTLLTPHGNPYPLREVDGGCSGGEVKGEGGGMGKTVFGM